MADTIKGKLQEAGNSVSEAATRLGNKVVEGVEQATDWAKEKTHQVVNRVDEARNKTEHAVQENFNSSSAVSSIQPHMNVVGSCGNTLGVVDRVDGSRIKLTRKDSPDGQHHFIPTSWVNRVDDRVHLTKDCGQAKCEWQSA